MGINSNWSVFHILFWHPVLTSLAMRNHGPEVGTKNGEGYYRKGEKEKSLYTDETPPCEFVLGSEPNFSF